MVSNIDNAPVARDRDRLRQQVLKGLGWTLHRVWSMDWYRYRAATTERLLEAIERAKTAVPEEQQTKPETEPIKIAPEVSTFKPESSSEPNQPVSNYIECAELGIPIAGDLHLQLPYQLAKAVVQIVKVESPVHVDEVILRIRSLWGLARAGARIREAVKGAVFSAKRSGQIHQRNEFLWATDEREIKVRQRTSPKIEWICDEEIAEAMKRVIITQGAISADALITESTRFFGYKATGATVVKHLRLLLDKLVKAGEFEILPNGAVRLP